MVEAITEMGHPGDVVFGRHEFEPRKTLQHTTDDEVGKGHLYRVRQRHIPAQNVLEGNAASAPAGQDMKPKCHVSIPCRPPERLVSPIAVALNISPGAP